jgi:peptidoglycan/LPS O-acetylase OafA/YrhL
LVEKSKNPKYRPDIDGLRAIAILLVIGFHATPGLIPGGYVGVDVFFVISGFLITGLLLEDLEKRAFSFAGFYARRIRRIFPALVVVLLVCLVAGWLLLPPSEFSSLGLNIFGGAAFSANLVLLKETGYFDLAAAQKPLLHLWSLGVEEQFYIVWPILLLLTFSRKISVTVLAVVLLIASFVWNMKEAGSPADFYLPVTRAWELMIGGILVTVGSQSEKLGLDRAMRLLRPFPAWKPPASWAWFSAHRDIRALLGLLLIVAAVIGLNKDSPFPGWRALLPTVGAALIISAEGAWLNRKILSSSLAVLIGLISYPLYLWHWPLLSFARSFDPEPSRQLRLAAILAAILLAAITYQWVEKPIRAARYASLKILILCLAMVVTGGAGLAIANWQGFPSRVPELVRNSATVSVDASAAWRAHTCFLEPNESKSNFVPECVERTHRPLLFLWGDSMAAALYPGLKQLQGSIVFGIAQFTAAGCPPVPSFPVPGQPHCLDNNDYVFSVLREVRPEIVLLYSAWSGSPAYGGFLPNLQDLVLKLRLLHIPRVIIMGPPPNWTDGLPKAAYDYFWREHRIIPRQSNFRLNVGFRTFVQNFREQVLPLGTEYISTWDALCRESDCTTRVGEDAADLIAFDQAHLTIPGSIYLAHAIAPCLFPDQGREQRSSSANDANQSAICQSQMRQSPQ